MVTVAAVWLAGTTPAAGQGVPVIDTSSIAQLLAQLEQMAQDYQTQVEQLVQLEAQYARLVDQLTAMTGAKQIADILNSAADIAERVASSEGMTAIVDGAIAGTEIAGNAVAINQTLSRLRENFDLDGLDGFLESEFAQDRAIASLAGSGMAAIATGEDSYRRANEAMARVTELIGRIDDNEDLKASVDFNTRMNAEIAVLLAENLRLQAAIATSLGAEALANARDGVGSREFLRITEE